MAKRKPLVFGASGVSALPDADRLIRKGPGVPGGRLTLTTGVPVTTSDVIGAGTLYYTPYTGSLVTLYDGTHWVEHPFTERSLVLALTSGKNYDVFLYDNAGTLTLELSAAWTTDTARADALALQDGVYVKSGAATRRYLGTIRASGANVTEDSAANRFVWNAYNRVARTMSVIDATDSWTYSTAAWRAANGSGSNAVALVIGLSEDPVRCVVVGLAVNSGGAVYAAVGVGVDSTSVNSAVLAAGGAGVTGKWLCSGRYVGLPGIGYHYLQWLEIASGATTTWYGDAGTAYIQTGLMAEVQA